MENDIEVCNASEESIEEQNQNDISYDLISRYYQILISMFENGASLNNSPEISHLFWSQFLITLSTLLSSQTQNMEQAKIDTTSNADFTTNLDVPLNLSGKECNIWSPARSLEQESLYKINNLQTTTTIGVHKSDGDKSDDSNKIFPVSKTIERINLIAP
ncbi:hypothetical protein PVAND_010160 [Polypedilum vanderplanki]|uniref:Uncharacterized protein n=1 Tax=Polypedilum vanderplanki TaxID=319348 RepID=A0A9J6CEW3_POLVA|nr:hypothetical protein PVAND_010160 [Polypedilum vanderplanki]